MPTLIDNGVVHIESNDIIDYLDETYPEPSLRAAGDEDGMLEWLRLAASIHVPAVKPYVYATKMQKKLKKTAEEQEKYDALQKNEELKEFHAKHAGASQFDEKDIARARETLEACFAKLENALEGREWMMGDRFTLADISWIPLHFVLVGCGYPFENHPNILRWAAALRRQGELQGGYPEVVPGFLESLNGRRRRNRLNGPRKFLRILPTPGIGPSCRPIPHTPAGSAAASVRGGRPSPIAPNRAWPGGIPGGGARGATTPACAPAPASPRTRCAYAAPCSC